MVKTSLLQGLIFFSKLKGRALYGYLKGTNRHSELCSETDKEQAKIFQNNDTMMNVLRKPLTIDVEWVCV